MRVGIIFSTDNLNLENLVGLRKIGIVPSDIRGLLEKNNHQLEYVGCSKILKSQGGIDLFDKISESQKFCEAVLIICCDRATDNVESLRDSAFVYTCDLSRAHDNVVNQLRSKLSKAVRKFCFLADRFGNMGQRKLLLLPFGAFKGTDLSSIRVLIHNAGGRADFHQELDRLLGAMRSRSRPKRKGNHAHSYVVDDLGRYFEYGLERHGEPETEMPPHTHFCNLNSALRFGFSFDRSRHFNVSLDGGNARIEGQFTNCHGEIVELGPSTHLNIFPNSFVR